MKRCPLLFSSLLLAGAPALQAQTATAPFEVVRLSDRVYALVGDLGQRSPQNLGHNKPWRSARCCPSQAFA